MQAFTDPYLNVYPNLERVPVELKVGFTINTNITQWDAIFVHLPRFTTSKLDVSAPPRCPHTHVYRSMVPHQLAVPTRPLIGVE